MPRYTKTRLTPKKSALKRPLRWVRFTERTNDPKLGWLEAQLLLADILCRRGGYSYHAPILEVPEDKLDAAWEILCPVDDVADDDSRFEPELWGVNRTIAAQIIRGALAHERDHLNKIVSRGGYSFVYDKLTEYTDKIDEALVDSDSEEEN